MEKASRKKTLKDHYDAGSYTFVENVDGSVTVSYDVVSYQFMINTFNADRVVGLNTMTLVIQGTAGKTLLLKPNDSGAMEQTVTFTGSPQTIVITAASFSKLLMFAAPGTAGETGTFTIISLDLTYVPAV